MTANNKPVAEPVCKERCNAFNARLKKVENSQEHLREAQESIALCLTKLTVLCENSVNQEEKLDARMTAVESRRSKLWDKILVGALSGVLGTLLGYFLPSWLT